MFVTSEKELGSALKAKPETITIEGEELVKKVVKIKSINKFAWILCHGWLGISADVFADVLFPMLRGYAISERNNNRMVLKRK